MNPDIMPYEAFAKEIMRRCIAEDEPEELRRWIAETVAKLGVSTSTDAIMTWGESFDFVYEMISEYERIAKIPEHERKVLSYPWQSWRDKIDPLEDGMLGLIAAPDGQGKTIYAESIAEYWASHKNRVVFVHYELNRKLMMQRRTARHTFISAREIKAGKLTYEQKEKIAASIDKLRSWDGYITYLHTPGWTIEKTCSELTRLKADGLCDVVVLDYLEKAAASNRQLRTFGTNLYQREADNVEQLKTFSEVTGVPVMMVAQMSKEGKTSDIDKVDRNGIRGAGEKSEKSNLVVLLKRDRTTDGYSNIVDVLVDKNTMGATAQFQQTMQPEYFLVADIYKGTK